jgi:predicted ABC-type transport system involved in lysophospholipase L1 biosynthesis ATPase subunit
MLLFDEIHQRGNTIILVTHEEYCLSCAPQHTLLDGHIEYDRIIEQTMIVNN